MGYSIKLPGRLIMSSEIKQFGELPPIEPVNERVVLTSGDGKQGAYEQ